MENRTQEKETAMSFRKRIEEIMRVGLDTSKDVLDKAKEKTKEASERSILKIKIGRLENHAERKFGMLGSKVYETLVEEGKSTVSKSTTNIKEIIEDIKGIEKDITKLEEQFKKLGRTESS
jgi:hypothetical protein